MAIRDAFAAAQRQLTTYAQCRRYQFKSHALPPTDALLTYFLLEGMDLLKRLKDMKFTSIKIVF